MTTLAASRFLPRSATSARLARVGRAPLTLPLSRPGTHIFSRMATTGTGAETRMETFETDKATPLKHAQNPARQPKTLPEFSLAGKVCMLTGGARGLGNEMCKAFLNSGCTELALVDLSQADAEAAAKELVDTVCANGDMKKEDFKVVGLACDVASEEAVQELFQRIHAEFGRVDVAVACAGIVENYSALTYPSDRMRKLYDINVHGAFYTAREAARLMIPRAAGSIILIGSMSGGVVNVPQPQMPYNASKAAVRHMGASLAVEWAKQGVRVNTISPGYMLTKLTRTILENDPELKKTWESLTPMGRMGEPEELAGAVVFLASDASRFMTGAELKVDGGYSVV